MIFQNTVFLFYSRTLPFNTLGTPKSVKKKLNDITGSSIIEHTPKRAKSEIGLEFYLNLNGYKTFKATHEISSVN